MEEKDFRDHEYYTIETDPSGDRWIHIEGYVWRNEDRTDDETGERKPYTSTEYCGAYLPLEGLLACRTYEEKRDLIWDAEANISQYEGDYTWEEFAAEGYDGPHGDHLPFDEITADTPDGDYEYYI